MKFSFNQWYLLYGDKIIIFIIIIIIIKSRHWKAGRECMNALFQFEDPKPHEANSQKEGREWEKFGSQKERATQAKGYELYHLLIACSVFLHACGRMSWDSWAPGCPTPTIVRVGWILITKPDRGYLHGWTGFIIMTGFIIFVIDRERSQDLMQEYGIICIFSMEES